MYVTKVNDVRLYNTPACNMMTLEQRNTWRKKVRAINERAKQLISPCYRYWPFNEIKPRTRKISNNNSKKRLEPVEVIIWK